MGTPQEYVVGKRGKRGENLSKIYLYRIGEELSSSFLENQGGKMHKKRVGIVQNKKNFKKNPNFFQKGIYKLHFIW